jgi:hypothetical protein
MTTATEYRRYAEECLAARRAAMTPEVRAALSRAAERWMALAERREEAEGSTDSAFDRPTQPDGAGAPARS